MGVIVVGIDNLTGQVRKWRADAVSRIAAELGLEHATFEAADPAVFTWYVKNYGIDVNLYVEHGQVVQLECLRTGIRGTHRHLAPDALVQAVEQLAAEHV